MESFIPEPNSGCWLFLGALSTGGYGTISLEGKQVRAHRAVYRLLRSEIPAGLVLDHLCRLPACVNPDHLEVVTHKENTLRGMSPHAVNARKTHCPRGHEYDIANTRISQQGRDCRACDAEHARARRRLNPKLMTPEKELIRARKYGAKRIGITYEEYVAQVEAGYRWCIGHKRFDPVGTFGRFKNGANGLAHDCKSFMSEKGKRRRRAAAMMNGLADVADQVRRFEPATVG
jgi:hypothetical protein